MYSIKIHMIQKYNLKYYLFWGFEQWGLGEFTPLMEVDCLLLDRLMQVLIYLDCDKWFKDKNQNFNICISHQNLILLKENIIYLEHTYSANFCL